MSATIHKPEAGPAQAHSQSGCCGPKKPVAADASWYRRNRELAWSIASGTLLVIGFNTLPVTNALQSTVGGGASDIGLVKVNATGTAILFAWPSRGSAPR